jgi:hypothetical protein
MMISETDKAYAAGVLDSDGSLGVYAVGNGHAKSQVVIAIQDTELLLWLQETWGGRIESNGKNQRVNKWIASTANIRKQFLLDVLPYLRTKKEVAQLVIDYIDCGRHLYSYEQYYAITKDLNSRLSKNFQTWVKELSTDTQGGE